MYIFRIVPNQKYRTFPALENSRTWQKTEKGCWILEFERSKYEKSFAQLKSNFRDI